MKIEQAREIVDALIRDIEERAGLRKEWEQIDENVKQQIREEWIYIVGMRG